MEYSDNYQKLYSRLKKETEPYVLRIPCFVDYRFHNDEPSKEPFRDAAAVYRTRSGEISIGARGIGYGEAATLEAFIELCTSLRLAWVDTDVTLLLNVTDDTPERFTALCLLAARCNCAVEKSDGAYLITAKAAEDIFEFGIAMNAARQSAARMPENSPENSPSDCKHESFAVEVKTSAAEEMQRSADLKIHCAQCRQPFEFVTLSIDHTQPKVGGKWKPIAKGMAVLQIPIRPTQDSLERQPNQPTC